MTSVSAVQLILPLGRFDEALNWARQAIRDCAAVGMRENFFALEILDAAAAAVGRTGLEQARAYAVARTLDDLAES